MSYPLQPPSPGGQVDGVAPFGAFPPPSFVPPTAAAAAGPTRGKALLFGGIAVAVVGIVVGVVLFAMSGPTREDTIKKFARAPAGCTTTLEFDRLGTYTLYLETRGSVDDAGGDCPSNGSSYDRGDGALPVVSLTMLDGAEQEMELVEVAGPSYSAGAFQGRALRQVDIAETGTYRLTVAGDASDFAVAVGGDPDADALTMQVAGVATVLVGMVLGALMMLFGRRGTRGRSAGAGRTRIPPPAVVGWQPHVASPSRPAGTALAPPAPPAAPVGHGWEAPRG